MNRITSEQEVNRKFNKNIRTNVKKLLMLLRSVCCLEVLAERTGLEPATPGVTGRYSNQLNYRSR